MFQNLDQLKVWKILSQFTQQKAIKTEELGSAKISTEYLQYHYALADINPELFQTLQNLTVESHCLKQFKALLDGDTVNLSEQRAVTHLNYRNPKAEAEKKVIQKLQSFCQQSREEDYQNIVHIGIGGSELAPKAMYYALRHLSKKEIPVYFISNLDAIYLQEVLNSIDVSKSLFILVSKSGTTQESMANYSYIENHYTDQNSVETLHKNTVIITGEGSPLSQKKPYKHLIEVPLSIGGRFSLLSPYTLCTIGVALGSEFVERALLGAASIDTQILKPNLQDNPALLAACISVWQTTFLKYPVQAIIPYCSQLHHFTFYLQQLICESLGKSQNQYKESITYPTGPLIMSFPGTNAQHTFFQLLHQGTQICPTHFIFTHLNENISTDAKSKEMHELLNLNGLAQMTALSQGDEDSFPGSRPVTAIHLSNLSPESFGALVAFYENMVTFKGFLLNINSFDQPGVELGKKLVKQHLAEPSKNPLLEQLNTSF